MVKESVRFLLGKDYNLTMDEFNRQNRLAIRYFAIAGIPVAIANAAAQSIVQGVSPFTPKNLLLLGYFVLLLIIERFVLPRTPERATRSIYVLVAPVLVISILLGTIWDPTHQAITFPMFMSIMPIFILDIPLRTIGINLLWNIIFVLVVTFTKDPSVIGNDYVHAAEFFFVSIAVTDIVLRLRFEVVYNLDRAKYHLEHDVLTNLRNRLSFEMRAEGYVGRPLFIVTGNVDHLALITDFYGNETGDDVFSTFAATLKDLFGEGDTYRYGGNDLLCVATDERAEDASKLLSTCRDRMRDTHFEGVGAPITYSFGFVTGTPSDSNELANMVQMAHIYTHQAQSQGEGRTVGGSFDAQAYRAAVVHSNLGIHAESYEINQLTGLPTMPYFVIHAEEMLHHILDPGRSPAIGYLNIVRFRFYNDTYGYAEGDQLIQTLARTLEEALPERHLAYLTGSKFLAMCYIDEIRPALGHINKALADYQPGGPIIVRAGFAEYQESDSVISLIDKARMAHRSIREREDGLFRLYDSNIDEEVRLQRYLVNNLDQAIANNWLQVYYQPIVWASNGQLCNLEALSRWIDPVHGFLSPAQFISALEKEQLIYKLSLHVIKTALADLKRLEAAGLPLVPISINLSRNDFFSCDMVEEIARLVEESGLEPHLLSLEITESAFAEDQGFLQREVERFHERGFAVWMDDFGSEYSTLNLLEELNFDLVKLDMRFMKNFRYEGRNAVIVSSILDMCQRLGMQTLVEGIETIEQRDLLNDMGTDKLQGFLFSRPLPYDQLVELAQERGWVDSLRAEQQAKA